MRDKSQTEFEERLDRLLSEYRDKLKTSDLAGALVATANGLLQLDLPRAQWNGADRVLSLPYVDAAALESSLSELLTLRAICVPLRQELPMLADVVIRVIAADESVDLRATTVQTTQAGVVFKLTEQDVDTQRALLALTATLRSRPQQAPALNARAVRVPNITLPGLIPDDAPVTERPVASAAPSPPAVSAAPGAVKPEPTRRPASTPTAIAPANCPYEERLVELETVEARLHRPDKFEVLGIHFSATEEEVVGAMQKLRELTEAGMFPDADEALLERLRRVRRRSEELGKELCDAERRHRHRKEVTNQFQLESLIDMYQGQVDTAKIRRQIPEAIAALRRLVEVQPDNSGARHELEALEAMESKSRGS